MDEETSTPYVDWDYGVIDADNQEVDFQRRPKNRDGSFRSDSDWPGSGWHIEFRGQTRGGELLLANYEPPSDQDAREWIRVFGAGSLPPIPISIDTYLGSQRDPEDLEDDPNRPHPDLGEGVGHTIYIGHGWVTRDDSGVIVTLPPEVFRDAATSLLSSFNHDYAAIEQRIFHLFTFIDPASFERFLLSLEGLHIAPPLDGRLIRHPRKPTYEHAELNPGEMIALLSRQDGFISFQQLYNHLYVQERTLRRWLKEAELLEAGHKRLTGWLFTSDEILKTFVPWLRRNLTTDGAKDFIRNLVIAKLIQL